MQILFFSGKNDNDKNVKHALAYTFKYQVILWKDNNEK